MGPMVRRPQLKKRRVAKLVSVWLVAMFTWSLVAAPESIGQAEPAAEPDELSAYSTFAEAAPVTMYLDHALLPAPSFGPALARSTTDVNQPSQASGLAYVTDFGIANGLHGTTTGIAVPTEASARQPGGADKAEYRLVGGPIGEEEFGRAGGAVARATATQQQAPRGFAHSYIGNLVLFPAAGTPPEPPGTYDPDQTFPGGPQQAPTPDPQPRTQMAVVAIGSIASTSESFRNGEQLTSIGVAEINNINIGNRTSDNRCTNCFVIDAIRVETFAQTDGTRSQASYRVMLGRACRRVLTTAQPPYAPITGEEEGLPKEEDQCLGPEPGSPYTLDGSNEELAQFNEVFGKPLVLPNVPCPLISGTGAPCTLFVRITAAQPGHTDPTRTERTATPPEDACRNYAYPDPNPKAKPIPECEALPDYATTKTGPDRDDGQEAKAVAEGIDIEILTATGTQLIPENADLDQCFGAPIPPEPAPGVPLGCPIGQLRIVRSLNLTLGAAQASAVARPNLIIGGDDGGAGGGGDLGGVIPPVTPPIGDGTIGGDVGGGGGVTVVGGGGLGAGKYALKLDWKSFKIRPWKAKDLAKAVFIAAIIGGMIWLIRRRLRFSAA